MKILYFTWNENSEKDICDAFDKCGYQYKKISHEIKDYDKDDELYKFICNELDNKIQSVKNEDLGKPCDYDCIFTFDYFPVISDAAQKKNCIYISWIYDCPHCTLFSNTVFNSCNRIFVFDKIQLSELEKRGVKNCFHMPLAVNVSRLDELMGKMDADIYDNSYIDKGNVKQCYKYNISFVGSLYNNNNFSKINYLPDFLKGYLDGVINAQYKIYGANFIKEVLDDNIINQLKEYIVLNDIDKDTEKEIFASIINEKITEIDRRNVLNGLALVYKDIALFTNSDTSSLNGISSRGIVDYFKEMPKVFRYSKINLNMTLRSITSGIPLRALDIMGAGGFLLTNYQPELAEYFEPGVDFVYYEDIEDCVTKAMYYLEHEDERRLIAYNGYKKVKEYFNYETALKNIMKTAGIVEEVEEAREAEVNAGILVDMVNVHINSENYDAIEKLLEQNRNITNKNNILSNVYYYAVTVHAVEKENGADSVFSKVSSVKELIERITLLQFYLRRIDFDLLNDKSDFVNFIINNKISMYELSSMIKSTIINQKKIDLFLQEL